MEAGKAFQLIQSTRSLEGGGVQLQRGVRRVAAGAAAGVFFQVRGVWGAVGAQEEFVAAAGGHLHQRLAVLFALEHGQAVVVRADAAGKDGVAVEQQVLRRDGGTDKAVGLAHVVGGFFGGDVFEDDFQLGEIAA